MEHNFEILLLHRFYLLLSLLIISIICSLFLGGGMHIFFLVFGILASNRIYSVLLGAVPEISSLCKLATASAILLPINSPVDSAVL